ncbi:MAG TPA: hypothetical protein VN653_14385 [Anaerolineales bacterium]|nr:hypothetical protein [Anaerolineales bacterium]
MVYAMKLPYHFPSHSKDVTQKIRERAQNGDIGAIKTLLYDWGNENIELLLDTLIIEVSAIPDCIGACLLTSAAHGYEFQDLVTQHPDGTYTIQKWSDLSKKTETSSLLIDLDLPTELKCLRKDNILLRGRGINHNVDRRSGMEGRGVSVFIIVGSEAESFGYSRLLLNGEYENNAANRILRAVLGMEGKVTLV